MRTEIELFGERVAVEGDESEEWFASLAESIRERAKEMGRGGEPNLRVAVGLIVHYAHEAAQIARVAEEQARIIESESAARREATARAEAAIAARAEAEAKLQEILERAAEREEALVRRIIENEVRKKKRARRARAQRRNLQGPKRKAA